MGLTLGTPGAQSELYVEPGASAHTFDSSSERWEFLREGIAKRGVITDRNSITGSRSHREEDTRADSYEVGGPLVVQPSPAFLTLWLPRILGANESADTFALAETLQAFGMLFDFGGGTRELKDCYVNRAVFRGRQGGGPIELELDIWAADEVTGTSVPTVALLTAANSYPYRFADLTLSLQSGSRVCTSFELTIENVLERRWGNSLTATSIHPTDRNVRLNCQVPCTSTEISALYGQAVGGAAGSLTLTNGNMSTVATFGKLQAPDRSPVVGGKGEVFLNLEMVARMTSTTREVVFTNDDTA